MIVGRASFDSVLESLCPQHQLAVDTETTGLRAYHDARLFSLIIADRDTSYYFNFQAYEGLEADKVLLPSHMAALQPLFADASKQWYVFSKFDLQILAKEGLDIAGVIHDCKAIALVEYNEHQDYDLASCAARIGHEKDNAVKDYINKHKLKETRQGATTAYTHEFYDRVPFPIIAPYGEQDGTVTFRVGDSQEKALQALIDATPKNLPSLRAVVENEKRLTRTVFRMEQRGVRIDRAYCVLGSRYETDRAEKAGQQFAADTGRSLQNSPKLFAEVFASDSPRWGFTEKGNPSFDSDNLGRFENPAAKAVLDYRDAISRRNFFNGFLYHADSNDVIHTNFNQDGAGHGRFSSSGPNLQNLTSDPVLICSKCKHGHEKIVVACERCESKDLELPAFPVRKAFIPRPGNIFVTPDYDQMEYRMMFDVACSIAGYETAVVKEIKNGKDPHQATADTVTALGTPLSRGRAKNGNFAWLYGSGVNTLAQTIGSSVEEARNLKALMAQANPEVASYIRGIMSTAERRRFIFNWLGRRCYFPDTRFAYRAPNYHIAGGCADVVKVAMNRVDEYLLGMKSQMVLMVHDELVIEVPSCEVHSVPKRVHEFMEQVYPYKYLPLTVGMEFSERNLFAKTKGFPS